MHLAELVKGLYRRLARSASSEQLGPESEVALKRLRTFEARGLRAKTADQSLAELVVNNVCGRVRRKALSAISDDEAIGHIVLYTKNYNYWNLLDRISAEYVMAAIAIHTGYFNLVERHVLPKMKNPSLLFEVATRAASAEVASLACIALGEAELKQVVRDARSPRAKAVAARLVKDEAWLHALLSDSADSAIRVAVIAALDDQAKLLDLARFDKDENVRAAAAERLSNQELLAGMVFSDP